MLHYENFINGKFTPSAGGERITVINPSDGQPICTVPDSTAADVEQALNGWRIPRVRNEKTGDLSHPSMVYVIGRDGRIAYVVNGTAEQIEAAVRAL